jgi:DNA-binding LacI/PurR family transcriptional regulator
LQISVIEIGFFEFTQECFAKVRLSWKPFSVYQPNPGHLKSIVCGDICNSVKWFDLVKRETYKDGFPTMTKVTIQDVANHAKVSKATVSRVMNDDPNVATDLRDRVVASMASLDYQPNRAARRLKKNLNDVIGLLIPDIQNPFFASVLRGAEDLAYDHGIGLMPYSTADDVARQQTYLEMLQGEQVAGLVIVPVPQTQKETLLNLQRLGFPYVLLDRSVEGVSADGVRVDSLHGAFAAVQHLTSLGYKRIGMISGLSELSTGRERLQGYQLALAEAGLPYDLNLVKPGNFDAAGGYQRICDFMLASHPPDAIFVGSNLMMMGVLQAIRDLNIRVPEDVALIGFDDLPLSGLLSPPLTIVAQPTYEMGQEALRLLLHRLKNPHVLPRSVILPTQLIVRESCGAKLKR